jgi:hypothetical protein
VQSEDAGDALAASVVGLGCSAHGRREVVRWEPREGASQGSVVWHGSWSVAVADFRHHTSSRHSIRIYEIVNHQLLSSEASGFQARRTSRQSQRPQRSRLVLPCPFSK